MEKTEIIMLSIVLISLAASTYMYFDNKADYARLKSHCDSTAEMYNLNVTEDGITYVLGVSYCKKDILLIDIKDREYWEALETFNHEWQHCHWGEHYKED